MCYFLLFISKYGNIDIKVIWPNYLKVQSVKLYMDKIC